MVETNSGSDDNEKSYADAITSKIRQGVEQGSLDKQLQEINESLLHNRAPQAQSQKVQELVEKDLEHLHIVPTFLNAWYAKNSHRLSRSGDPEYLRFSEIDDARERISNSRTAVQNKTGIDQVDLTAGPQEFTVVDRLAIDLISKHRQDIRDTNTHLFQLNTTIGRDDVAGWTSAKSQLYPSCYQIRMTEKASQLFRRSDLFKEISEDGIAYPQTIDAYIQRQQSALAEPLDLSNTPAELQNEKKQLRAESINKLETAQFIRENISLYSPSTAYPRFDNLALDRPIISIRVQEQCQVLDESRNKRTPRLAERLGLDPVYDSWAFRAGSPVAAGLGTYGALIAVDSTHTVDRRVASWIIHGPSWQCPDGHVPKWIRSGWSPMARSREFKVNHYLVEKSALKATSIGLAVTAADWSIGIGAREILGEDNPATKYLAPNALSTTLATMGLIVFPSTRAKVIAGAAGYLAGKQANYIFS